MATKTNHAAMILNAMSVHYGAWLDSQGLPQQCAMELLHEDLTAHQRAWLSQFVIAWEGAQRMMEIESY